MRANIDFMVLDAWMSISRNFHIRFHKHLIYRSCSIGMSLNNRIMKLFVNITHPYLRVQNHKVAVRTHASAVLIDSISIASLGTFTFIYKEFELF